MRRGAGLASPGFASPPKLTIQLFVQISMINKPRRPRAECTFLQKYCIYYANPDDGLMRPAVVPLTGRSWPPPNSLGSAVIGAPMEAAFVRRTWSTASVDRRPRSHVFFVVRGRASFVERNGTIIEANGPCVLWLPKSALGEFHLEAGGEGVALSVLDDFVWRAVGDSGVATHLRRLLAGVSLATAERITPHRHELAVSFAALVRESREAAPGASVMMGLHLGVVLVRLWRASGLEAARGARGARGAAAGALPRFRQLVELHYRENLSIDEFARLLGVTRSHLRDACARGAGATPLGLVHDRLIEEACLRLQQSELSIEQIGYSLGFRDPGYFNRFFKRRRGMAPGAYRKSAARRRGGEEFASSYAAWP